MSSLTRQLPDGLSRVRTCPWFVLSILFTAVHNNNNNNSYPPYHSLGFGERCGPVRRLSSAFAFGALVRPPSQGTGLTPPDHQITRSGTWAYPWRKAPRVVGGRVLGRPSGAEASIPG